MRRYATLTVAPLFAITLLVTGQRAWAEADNRAPCNWNRDLKEAVTYLRPPGKSYFMARYKADRILKAREHVPLRVKRTAARIAALAHIGDLRAEMRRHNSLVGQQYMTNNTFLPYDRWLEMTRDLYQQAHDSLQWEVRRVRLRRIYLTARTAGAVDRQRARAEGLARFFKFRADMLDERLRQLTDADARGAGRRVNPLSPGPKQMHQIAPKAPLNSVAGVLSRHQELYSGQQRQGTPR